MPAPARQAYRLPTTTSNAPTTDKPKRAVTVSGRLKTAIDAMIWQGFTRAQAAEHATITEHALYCAFRKPHVKAYYLRELDVLRTSERARNFHALTEVRDQRDNQMARVNAVKAMEQISDDPTGAAARTSSPGFVIVINGAANVQASRTDPKLINELDGAER